MTQHVLVYGCGSMARALTLGLKAANPEWKFTCWTPSGTKAESLAKELNGTWLKDLAEIPQDLTAVFLGFKPQMLAQASAGLQENIKTKIPFVSMLAAITLTELESHFSGRPLLRLMPNLAVSRRQGVVLWEHQGLGPSELSTWEKALATLGLAPHVPEHLIDVYTIHAASSPAFVYQWLKDAGEFVSAHGGDPQEAVNILAQALRGTLEAGPFQVNELDEKIKSVASKGGVTQAVLDEWKTSLPQYIKQGFEAGLNRLKQMKKS